MAHACPLAHADFTRLVDRVDGIELDVVLCNVLLDRVGQVMLQLLAVPLAVQQEDAARLDILNDLVALEDVCGNVAGNEVCLGDVVRGLDRLIAEAQVRDSHAARLL